MSESFHGMSESETDSYSEHEEAKPPLDCTMMSMTSSPPPPPSLQQMSSSSMVMPSVTVLSDAYHDFVTERSAAFQKDSLLFFSRSLQRMEQAYQEKLSLRESELQAEISSLHHEIHSLENDLSSEQNSHQYTKKVCTYRTDYAAAVMARKWIWYTSPQSVRVCFNAWKTDCERERNLRRLEKLTSRVTKKYDTFRAFALFAANHRNIRHQKKIAEVKFKYDTMINELTSKYEEVLVVFRRERDEALEALRREQVKRQVLEEEMRRLLVRNISFMNKEVLDIFTHINADLPNGAQATDAPATAVDSPEKQAYAHISALLDDNGHSPLPSENPPMMQSTHSPTTQHSSSSMNGRYSQQYGVDDSRDLDRLSQMYRQSMSTSQRSMASPAGQNAGNGDASPGRNSVQLRRSHQAQMSVKGQAVKSTRPSSASRTSTRGKETPTGKPAFGGSTASRW